MKLRKTGDTKGANFYRGDDGKDYQIRAVDRKYPGRKNPPIYYLERVEKGKAKYMSGLFKTKKPAVFSFDLKDKITGVRVMFDAKFENEGSQLEILQRSK